jgi:hypothetical protein
VDDTELLGPRHRLADRIKAWKAPKVSTMPISTGRIEMVRLLAELIL